MTFKHGQTIKDFKHRNSGYLLQLTQNECLIAGITAQDH